VAAALLVVSIGADALMNRTYVLEVQDGAGGWHVLARSQPARGLAVPAGGLVVNATNGSVAFRLRETNTYLWASSTPWEARVDGASFAHGTLSSPARGEGEATFAVPTSAWSATQTKAPEGAPAGTFASVEVDVGDTPL